MVSNGCIVKWHINNKLLSSIYLLTVFVCFQPPPVRIMILGPRGSGKTTHGRHLAKKLGLFHIQYRERLQELVIAKTKKKIGPEFEEEQEEPEEEEEEEEWVILTKKFGFKSVILVLAICTGFL